MITIANKYKLDSFLYLIDTESISGENKFPSPNGNAYETGHQGNGYVKLCLLYPSDAADE